MRQAPVFIALFVLAGLARAESRWGDPDEGGFTKSLGLPQMWRLSAGAAVGAHVGEPSNQLAGELRFSYQADLLNPVMALLAVRAEGLVAFDGPTPAFGARAMLVSPALRFGLGLTFDTDEQALNPILSLLFPVRRGGIFGAGSLLRLDWQPDTDGGHTFLAGVEVPLRRLIDPGRSRPERDHVPLRVPPREPAGPAPSAAAFQSLVELRESALWVRRLVVPALGQTDLTRAAALDAFEKRFARMAEHLDGDGTPRSATGAVERWHRALEGAFALALAESGCDPERGPVEAARVAAEVRRVLLDEVLLPWNRLLGQDRVPDTLLGFGATADARFAGWMLVGSGLPDRAMPRLSWTFSRLIEILEENRELATLEWGDPRFVWLPLQYALRPEEHDTQAELDALVERSLERPFTRGNRIEYLANEQFHLALLRSLHEARRYHVLWVHDFRGRNEEGRPDEISFLVTVEGYLAALTERVRAYDETGELPVFMIFLDQWFYEVTDGRLYLSFLEEPLGGELDLPAGYEDLEKRTREAQAALREAVEGSRLLQAQAAQFGEAWLRNRLKVHVNVTNPADDTFWSGRVIPLIGIPDNMMRDHRKVAFRDLSEADPWAGEALLTGMGVGEQYVGSTWQDRSLLAQGPVNLELKAAARRLLAAQGFSPAEIPEPLRPDDGRTEPSMPPGFDGGAAAVQLHNGTGYAEKDVNVAKALLYSLMPPGSLTLVPDSIWTAPLWGSLLLGQALRGGRVLVIAPALANAPSAAFPQMSRAEELLARLVLASNRLAAPLARARGLLRVGLYDSEHGVYDLPARLGDVQEGLRAAPWLAELLGVGPEPFARLQEELEPLFAPRRPPGPRRPKLHMKVNFLASGEALRALHDPAWPEVLEAGIEYRAGQLLDGLTGTSPETLGVRRELERRVQALAAGLRARLAPAEEARLVLYMLLGSHNQNDRSLVMDGELAYLVAGPPAVNALIDLVLLAPEAAWPDTLEELHGKLPPKSGLKRFLGQWLRTAL